MAALVRGLRRVVRAHTQTEGAGFVVERPFPGRITMEEADPFLLFDHLGPVTYAPGKAKGAPWHPHRGFETVSYILQGELQHRDSMGNSGFLRAGDVQWMTAGSGIIHDEEPSDAMKQKGGTMEGFQVWVNLPKAEKMCAPKYQDISRDKIPEVVRDKLRVKVIAGEALGQRGAVATTSPITYLDVHADQGAEFSQTIPAAMDNGLVFVYRGSGLFGKNKTPVGVGECGLIDNVGTEFAVSIAGADGCKFLLLAGKRLNEPISQMGPFVMNTMEEVREAYREYQAGKLVKHTANFASKAEHDSEYDPKTASIVN